MFQLTLFGPAERVGRKIERADPAAGKAETSQAAARSVRGAAALRQREQVYGLLRDAGRRGATREELAEASGIKLQSICGRINELVRLGLATECGETRATQSGRKAGVVVAQVG